ncbi:hypothetical protein Tsubulata_006738 [Turnera subulata]|uniref:DUF4283 domain-containing protein n=1 Tax=Turnera subulata TaxID=218843 RepID=A0A9Q0GIS6_9ROSI|nr:hypothetical protein Tsubulata_006738 [Turnera subulata]
MEEVEVIDMGRDSVLACFPSQEAMLQFTQRPPDWIPLWGVPLNAWCQGFFETVGSKFGKFLRVDESTEQRRSLGTAWVEVLTEQKEHINRQLRISIAKEESGEDGSESERGEGDGEGKTSRADFQGESQDPFGIMEILQPDRCPNVRKVALSKRSIESAALKKVDVHDEAINTGVGGEIICHNCSQLVCNGPPILRPVGLKNSFGPLMDVGEGDLEAQAQNSNSKNSPQRRSGTSTPSITRSSKFSGSFSKQSMSATSKSSSYFVRRLDAAIKTARVSQRHKFKKLKDTGSLTSQSSTNDAIKRVNERIVQSPPEPISASSPTSPDSLQLQEAIETVQLGQALDWEVVGST